MKPRVVTPTRQRAWPLQHRARCAQLLVAASLFGGALCAVAATADEALSPPNASTAVRSDKPAVADRVWAMRVPLGDKVAFRGAMSRDAAGLGTTQMLYGPGPVGFVAALVTHGVINASLRKSQDDKMQREADRVLAPFSDVLSRFTNRQLMEGSLPKLSVAGIKRLAGPASQVPEVDWLVESAPTFSMTQDQRALILDVTLRIFAPNNNQPVYLQTIRVVSLPLATTAAVEAATTSTSAAPAPSAIPTPASASASASASAPQDAASISAAAQGASVPSDAVTPFSAIWLESHGQRLLDESFALLAESLDIAFQDSIGALGDPKATQKTFRYPEGGAEKMERAQWVAERCDRTVIRTLRGWLMSIPRVSADGRSTCGDVSAKPRPTPSAS